VPERYLRSASQSYRTDKLQGSLVGEPILKCDLLTVYLRAGIDDSSLYHCEEAWTTTGRACNLACWYLKAYNSSKTPESTHAWSSYLGLKVPKDGHLNQTAIGMQLFLSMSGV